MNAYVQQDTSATPTKKAVTGGAEAPKAVTTATAPNAPAPNPPASNPPASNPLTTGVTLHGYPAAGNSPGAAPPPREMR